MALLVYQRSLLECCFQDFHWKDQESGGIFLVFDFQVKQYFLKLSLILSGSWFCSKDWHSQKVSTFSIQQIVARMVYVFWELALTYKGKGATPEIKRAWLSFVTGTQAINLFFFIFPETNNFMNSWKLSEHGMYCGLSTNLM